MIEEKRSIYSYILLSISSILVVLITWYLTPILGKTTVYMLLVMMIIGNAAIGGLQPGLLMTFVSSLAAIYFFLIPFHLLSSNVAMSIQEITLFTVTGILLSFIIEKYKKTDIVGDYTKKELKFKKHLEQLEKENTKMKQEIKLREEFLSIASHELKTPLTSMLLKLQLVLHNIRNVSLANFSVENLLKMLETAEQQTQRLSRLINDLLNVSLITTGKWNLELGRADLVALVKEVVSEFSEKLDKAGYTLKLETDGPVEVLVDKLRIEQLITNLLSNAIKYGNGEPIDVEVKKNSSHAKLIVKDHGIGIKTDQKERIFGLFERGVTDSKIKGLGVGLYIANQIIAAHHGKIKVDSKENHGSTFTVELPLTQSSERGE